MWIRVDVATPDGRKLRKLAREIEQRGAPPIPAHDTRALLGTLVLLWIRTRIQAPDGLLAGYAVEDIADLVGCSADEAAAMLEAGWIDSTPDGPAVHGWMEHNGEHLREAKRKREARATGTEPGRAKPGAAERPASSVASRPVPSRPVARKSAGRPPDVRGLPRTLPEGPQDSPGPDPDHEPAREPAGPPVPAVGPRAALYASLGVEPGEADMIDAHLGLGPRDETPDAQRRRTRVAGLPAPERAELLAPQGEANRQRLLNLLGLVAGGRAPDGTTLEDLRRETGTPVGPRPNIAAIAERAKPLGRTGQAAAIRLAQWLFNRGVAHEGLLMRFIAHYCDNASAIREPFAYYNPGRDGFELIRTRCAAEAAQDEHEALKAAEQRWLRGAASA